MRTRVRSSKSTRSRRLKLTHFSPLSGDEDVPENYHTLVYELEGHGDTTRVSLSQSNNATEEDGRAFEGQLGEGSRGSQRRRREQ